MRRWLMLGFVVLAACTSATPAMPSITAPAAATAAALRPASTPTVSPAATAAPTAARVAPPSPSAAPSATPTLDPRTAAAIGDLDEACRAVPGTRPLLPLAQLVRLADGRSAYELIEAVGRSSCVLTASARGQGGSELALISNYADAAVLWVDNGWWRASVQPLMRPTVLDDRLVSGGRELTIGICPCGSGGDIGVAVLRIDGPFLTPLVIARPGTSHVSARRLGDDLLHMVGRGGDGRPIAWTANCCAPGLHQWLYVRRGTSFVLVAERQPYDPHYVAGLFFGGLKAGRVETLGDIASPEALAEARPVFATALDVEPPSGNELYARTGEELMRWAAIPEAFRRTQPPDPVVMTFGLYPPTSGAIRVTQRARIEIRPREAGWYVARFEIVP